ncbi:MAG TPA: hypothetical protein VGO59_06100 [Verrucomicrobiae bacterium]|jgi:hypothetical protein
MKTRKKEELPFGDLVAAAYQVWGDRLAAKMLRLAIKARLIVFRGRRVYLQTSARRGAA